MIADRSPARSIGASGLEVAWFRMVSALMPDGGAGRKGPWRQRDHHPPP